MTTTHIRLLHLLTTTTILPLFAFVSMYSCASSAVARDSKTRSTFTWSTWWVQWKPSTRLHRCTAKPHALCVLTLPHQTKRIPHTRAFYYLINTYLITVYVPVSKWVNSAENFLTRSALYLCVMLRVMRHMEAWWALTRVCGSGECLRAAANAFSATKGGCADRLNWAHSNCTIVHHQNKGICASSKKCI